MTPTYLLVFGLMQLIGALMSLVSGSPGTAIFYLIVAQGCTLGYAILHARGGRQ